MLKRGILVNQNDYDNKQYITKTDYYPEDKSGLETTIKSSGCGLCCAVMMARIFDIDFDLDDAINLAYECKANNHYGTNFFKYSKAYCEKLNLSCSTSSDYKDMYKCLDEGGVVLINVGGDNGDHLGVFSHIGHYILATGHDNDTVEILDPDLLLEKYQEEHRIGKVKIDGEYIYSDIENIILDTRNRELPYFLFKKVK